MVSKYRAAVFIASLLFLLSSCISPKQQKLEIEEIYQERIGSFPQLSQKEILRRKNQSLPTFNNDWSDQNSVASIIRSSIIDSISRDKKFIEIDLRHYKSAALGNIMFSTIEDDDLDQFLYFSKFDQQFFILFNFSDDLVTIVNGDETSYDFENVYIAGDVKDKELIFNVSDTEYVQCNIKFTPHKPVFSFIANNIKKAPCDIREISNSLQNFLYNISTFDYVGGDWRMKLLSINESRYSFDGGAPKLTFGSIENVMNRNVKELKMGVFKNMNVMRYYDNDGKKFRYKERSD